MKICSRKKCKKIVESTTFKQCQKCRDKGKKDSRKRSIRKKENLEKSNNFDTLEYFNHLLNVHRYISFTTKNFLPLQNQLKYIKNRKLIATLSNCGNSLTV